MEQLSTSVEKMQIIDQASEQADFGTSFATKFVEKMEIIDENKLTLSVHLEKCTAQIAVRNLIRSKCLGMVAEHNNKIRNFVTAFHLSFIILIYSDHKCTRERCLECSFELVSDE